MHSSSLSLHLLRTLTLLNAFAIAVLVAALTVFGREWPHALWSLVQGPGGGAS